MRVALIGVSHWHTPFFLDPCLELGDVAIVGVCDPDLPRTGHAAAKAGFPALYLYPAPNSVFDLHYSIRTRSHYFAARDCSTLEIVSNDRQRTTKAMKLTNVHFYPIFVRDTLQRLKDGRKPIADLADNAATVALV